jgi:hypothetical protein
MGLTDAMEALKMWGSLSETTPTWGVTATPSWHNHFLSRNISGPIEVKLSMPAK